MNNEQAKEILKLYRPDTADDDDVSFAEALELCGRDAELKQWFGEHCALYRALRAKFKQIAVPEGLKEQIISERKVHTASVWQRAIIAGGVVAIAVLTLTGLNSLLRKPHEPRDFAAYRSQLVGFAQLAYGMQFETNNLDQIHSFFVQTNAVADYVLPDGVKKNAQAAGCVATTWRGKPVSMICFQTGRPLPLGEKSDLWLFVTGSAVASDAPASSIPRFEKLDDVTTASWTSGNKTYVLAVKGDEKLLRNFL